MQAAERVLAQQEQLQEQLQQAKAARLDAKLEQVLYDYFFSLRACLTMQVLMTAAEML